MKILDNPSCYENFPWENSSLGKSLREKVDKILETIPEDVKTIINISCDNGAITNELGEKYDVTGIDQSANTLKFVTTNKTLSSSDKINIPAGHGIFMLY